MVFAYVEAVTIRPGPGFVPFVTFGSLIGFAFDGQWNNYRATHWVIELWNNSTRKQRDQEWNFDFLLAENNLIFWFD